MLQLLVRQTIRTNRRPDGLYHAYNLVKFDKDSIEISNLYEMLEGQVAVLSSGLLSPSEAADLMDAMRASALYRPDQQSYMLSPNRRRPSFLEVNNVSTEVKSRPEYPDLLAAGILSEDLDGGVHFNAEFHNADHLISALESGASSGAFST